MNNVLIAIDTSESSLWLAYYAMGLARRTKANVSLLMVMDETAPFCCPDSDEWIGLPEKRLESLLAEDHSERAHVNYYVARGVFDAEVIRFIQENAITTLFIGQPPGGDPRRTRWFMDLLERISTQTRCHIEVVQKVSIQGESR
ncbi:universal stress protein [Desulfovibrio inopinatus]|uniref:universal stress protein n=1 Tax=Desulfovibrio inopinatus TaxID=102109 RepID=UPI00040D1FA7|nr:universal stress protein [Desulfovibrio inopinatus]